MPLPASRLASAAFARSAAGALRGSSGAAGGAAFTDDGAMSLVAPPP